MKKLLVIVCIIFFNSLFSIGCKTDIMTDNISEQENYEATGSTAEPINSPEVTVEKTEDSLVQIDVYINDILMDVTVYKNENGPNVGDDAYNLRDFIVAQPILDFLETTCDIDETNDTIILKSEKYGTIERTYSTYAKVINDELYISFVLFRVYTNGSLSQDGYSAMYLYSSDYERTDIPATLEECYAMLDEELDAEDIEFIRDSTEEERIEMHFGLGLWIRNNWLNPTQSKITELIYDNGILHTDDMSALIIEGYYRYLNNEPCSLEELISWYMDN